MQDPTKIEPSEMQVIKEDQDGENFNTNQQKQEEGLNALKGAMMAQAIGDH